MNKAQDGLPNHLFKYVSSITPIINVDLIIHNPKKGIILSWRADKYYGPGWHVPGGIIRFKENIIDRLHHVAREEINLNNDLDFSFITINQIMNPNRDIRGHFISLLFASKLDNPYIDNEDFKDGMVLGDNIFLDNIKSRSIFYDYIRKIKHKYYSKEKKIEYDFDNSIKKMMM